MRVGSHPAFRANGRIQGTFVYLLLCEEGPAIYAKIGVASNPVKRLTDLRVACPLEIGVLAAVELPSRVRAFQAEKALHRALADFSVRGEWFRFQATDKSRVNDLMREALSDFASPSWPMQWTKINACELLKQQQASVRVRLALSKRRGFRV